MLDVNLHKQRNNEHKTKSLEITIYPNLRTFNSQREERHLARFQCLPSDPFAAIPRALLHSGKGARVGIANEGCLISTCLDGMKLAGCHIHICSLGKRDSNGFDDLRDSEIQNEISHSADDTEG